MDSIFRTMQTMGLLVWTLSLYPKTYQLHTIQQIGGAHRTDRTRIRQGPITGAHRKKIENLLTLEEANMEAGISSNIILKSTSGIRRPLGGVLDTWDVTSPFPPPPLKSIGHGRHDLSYWNILHKIVDVAA